MSELPLGWLNLKIGDVIDVVSSTDPRKRPNTNFAYIDIGSIDNQTQTIAETKNFLGRDAPSRARRIVQTSDVLFSTVRTYLKNIAVVPAELDGELTSTGIAVLRSNGAVEPRYLFNWVCSDRFVQDISASQDGTLYPAVTDNDVRLAPIPLAPLAEQRRIVAKVDGLTACTARARKDLDRITGLVVRYKERLLSLALAGELTSAWRELRNLASGKEVQLGEVAEHFDYGSSAKSSKEGSIPVLRMGNIQDGRLDWSDLVYTSEPGEIDKYRLQRGDVLFNRTNSPALVGKTALFDSDREAIHAGYLIRVRCGPSLLPSFLTYCLNSPMGRAYSWQVKTDGVSQSNINAKKLAAFPFWLPSLDEQAEIVRRIDTAFDWLARVAAEHAAAMKLLSKLDSAILAKAFRGELVPQDPSDEPARALLARIRAEPRAAAAKERPVRSDGTVLESRGRLRDEVIRAPKRTKGREVSKSRQDDEVLGKPYLAGKLKKMPSRSVQDLFRVADLGIADFYKQLAWEIAEGHIIDDAETLQAA